MSKNSDTSTRTTLPEGVTITLNPPAEGTFHGTGPIYCVKKDDKPIGYFYKQPDPQNREGKKGDPADKAIALAGPDFKTIGKISTSINGDTTVIELLNGSRSDGDHVNGWFEQNERALPPEHFVELGINKIHITMPTMNDIAASFLIAQHDGKSFEDTVETVSAKAREAKVAARQKPQEHSLVADLKEGGRSA